MCWRFGHQCGGVGVVEPLRDRAYSKEIKSLLPKEINAGLVGLGCYKGV
jgi:hypothetical protein